MMCQYLKNIMLGFVATILIVAANAGSAHAIAFNFDWTGSDGYSMDGMFSYDDSLIGTGATDETDLTTFMIELYLNGESLGTWDFFADGLIPDSLPMNFNFDASSESFLVGGPAAGTSGQTWNTSGNCSPGFGFQSGSGSQLLCIDGFPGGPFGGPIEISQSTLTAIRKDLSPVVPAPEPSTLSLVATGLALLGFMGWRRRKAA